MALYLYQRQFLPGAPPQKLHLEMLSDQPRTLAYKAAIERARGFIQDKVGQEVL